MKKILYIHTNYQELGGEDIAVKSELNLLKEVYEVREIFFSNEVKNKLTFILNFITLRNFKNYKFINNIINEFNPDLAYVHNTWFDASLSVFKALKVNKIKTYVKLHNFRFFCTRTHLASRHLMGDSFCKACGFKNHRFFFSYNKYFLNSFLKSFFVNRFGKKYFNLLKNESITLLVLTNFQKEFLKKFDINNVYVFPNYIDFTTEIKDVYEDYFVYAGRISEEKGLSELISSFSKVNQLKYELLIVGNGPEVKKLKKNNLYEHVKFLGSLSHDETLEIISKSSGVVSATKLYEGQPTQLVEASLLKKHSIFPNSGGISEFLPSKANFLFEQYNYDDLTQKFLELINLIAENKKAETNHQFIIDKLNKNKLLEKFETIIS